jgi:hypothetical protein
MEILFLTSFTNTDLLTKSKRLNTSKQQEQAITFLRYLLHKSSFRDLKIITNVDLSIIDKQKLYINKYKTKLKTDDSLNIPPYTQTNLSKFRTIINEVDAVIIENSFENFRLGFQAAVAISYFKPILILNKNAKTNFKSPLITITGYTRYTTPIILNEFFKKIKSKNLTQKINFFISKEQKDAIQKKALIANSSEAEVMRRLIDSYLTM